MHHSFSFVSTCSVHYNTLHMQPVGKHSNGISQKDELLNLADGNAYATPPERAQKDFQSGPQGSLILYALVALGLALFIRFYIAAPYIVQGASMSPTFDDFHYLIIDVLTYDFDEPARGDVIVFEQPHDGSRALIKRIIGLPGETVILRGSSVVIKNAEYPDGFTLDEPYVDPANQGGATDTQVVLGEDQFFVLGDNRRVSADSRLWGKLPREDITGRGIVRLYPFPDIGILPGKYKYGE